MHSHAHDSFLNWMFFYFFFPRPYRLRSEGTHKRSGIKQIPDDKNSTRLNHRKKNPMKTACHQAKCA